MELQKNQLLARLPPDDRHLLQPHLQSENLRQDVILTEMYAAVRRVYFPTDSIVSIVVVLLDGHTVESAMIDRDGVVNAAAAMNGQTSFTQAIVQHGGHAFLCEAATFKDLASQSKTLTSLIWQHESVLYAQSAQSTACMSAHDIESRLCRWLLRSRDLRGSDELHLTQEFLGKMLGVRRNSVTVAAQTLARAGLITYVRGNVHILDPNRLKEATCECYETVNRNYEMLLGNPQNPRRNETT